MAKETSRMRERMRSAARSGRVLAERARKPQSGKPLAQKPARAPRSGSPTPMIGERVIQPLPLYLQLQRIGGGLTPAQVSEIIREADMGRMYRLADLANEMRQKDCHLQGILDAHETELAGLEWTILPPKDATAKEQEAADFCTKALQNITDLPDLFAHLAGGFYHGYAVAETLYDRDGPRIVPTAFDRISPRRMVFELTQGRLQQWDQAGGSTPYPGIDLMTAFPGKFIQFTPRVNGDVQCREGLVRPLMWAALFRNWTQRDWLSLAELSWKPWRTGVYKKGASDDDIRNLFAVLENMVANGIAVYAEGADVKVEWPKNLGPGGSPHAQLFDILGREMSKAVLGNSMTTELSLHGNQTAARTGHQMQAEKRNARAKKIAAAIRAFALTPLVRMNYGDDVRVPGFEFATEDEVDMLQFAQAVKTVGDAGLKRIQARHVRDKLGIPEACTGEEVLEPATDALASAAHGAAKPGLGGPTKPEKPTPKKKPKPGATPNGGGEGA